MPKPTYDVVVPTVGRPSLELLLEALSAATGPPPGQVIVVDDRAQPWPPLDVPATAIVLRSGGRGPAAARNRGWRAASAPWVAFLDDDVIPAQDWPARLVEDLGRCGPRVAGSQGRVRVPRPQGRRPTDRERNTIGLETAQWATADLAYRRRALEAVGGFDEGFTRAYREDADIALRVVAVGWQMAAGRRLVHHPVRPAPWWASVPAQRGNADDARMAHKHGRAWRPAAGTSPGRFLRHVALVAAGMAAGLGMAAGHRRLAAAGGLAWAAGTAELVAARVRPGPRTPGEVAAMVATSIAVPPAAVAWRLAGEVSARRLPDAVLFDRDGTLVHDVPYNGDPDLVRPVAGAREAVDRVRAAGIPVGVVSNQSGVARGLLTTEQVRAVNQRVDDLLGPFGAWSWCPHGEADRCDCRKPRPGLVVRAAAELGVDARRCVVIGDIGADVEAARAVGARAVLVPTRETLAAERDAAPEQAPDLGAAVDRVLGVGA